ncbi:hypothetical protein KP509_23G059500 [Ceratopteris richardii]|uniref:Uncharacterized protein n=1 Tax=Ceratopteris richardii TaxID=49495 RepID=A0A8T2S0Y0_CERRI|nr:hypothetical protein KP509_23G059500 [Ceratopteris richardii]
MQQTPVIREAVNPLFYLRILSDPDIQYGKLSQRQILRLFVTGYQAMSLYYRHGRLCHCIIDRKGELHVRTSNALSLTCTCISMALRVITNELNMRISNVWTRTLPDHFNEYYLQIQCLHMIVLISLSVVPYFCDDFHKENDARGEPEIQL